MIMCSFAGREGILVSGCTSFGHNGPLQPRDIGQIRAEVGRLYPGDRASGKSVSAASLQAGHPEDRRRFVPELSTHRQVGPG